jgi:biopolymer transport protein TolR
MRLGEPGRMNSSINITPLVDVVLVLLIIFMVMAPQMRTGPEVDLPDTAKPKDQGDERSRILVTLDQAGKLWIDNRGIAPEQLAEGLRAAAENQEDPQVVLRSDATLRFGDVRRAMVAIEDAGFKGVGLIADSQCAKTEAK